MGTDPTPPLSPAESAVLRVLVGNPGRVLGRDSIMRAAGLTHCGVRRCDSVLVGLRRALGEGSIITVRRRGWRLSESGLRAGNLIIGQGAGAGAVERLS